MRPPVLVINGAHDVSLERGRETASLIPGARHVVLPGTGHACCIEDRRRSTRRWWIPETGRVVRRR